MIIQYVLHASACKQETQVQSLDQEDSLEKGMAIHSSILTWRIPRTEESSGYCPWSRKESDTTEQLTHFHFSACAEDHMELRILCADVSIFLFMGFPGGGKESVCQYRRCGLKPWVRKIPQRRIQQPTPVFLPGKSHGQRRLVGYSPWVAKELDTT